MNAISRLSPKRIRNMLPRKKPGSAPGTLTHVGEKLLDKVSITVHDYNQDHLIIKEIENVEECRPFTDTPAVTWVQVKGLHDLEILKELWAEFDFHLLVQEDIINTNQRPKVEDYGDQVFIVMKMISVEEEEIRYEQVSIVLADNYVFSFQESDKPFFDPIKTRLQVQKSRLRTLGPDYTAYALVDTIVDYYFTVLEEISEQIDTLEDELIEDTEHEHLRSIHTLRRELIRFRKSIWPLRDSLNSLLRDEYVLIKPETLLFIRDVYDHLIQAIDSVDNFREMVSSLHDMYMTNISNKMNEIMKLLTIISTIFIPLTFIAGIYGMNFEYMPELKWKWSYPLVWVIMLIASAGMAYFFRRKKWL